MWKVVAAGAAVVMIAGSTIVFAQGSSKVQESFDFVAGGLSADAVGTLTDARIGALKAVLQLTPTQEAQWPAFEAALREMIKARFERIDTFRNDPSGSNLVARLRSRGEAVIAMGNGLKNLADAAEPLFRSLDDTQKRRLKLLEQVMDVRHTAMTDGLQSGELGFEP
jgi:LTXXQ motif family protein